MRYFLAFSYNRHDSARSIADEKRFLLVLEAERFFGEKKKRCSKAEMEGQTHILGRAFDVVSLNHHLSHAAMVHAFPGGTDVMIDACDGGGDFGHTHFTYRQPSADFNTSLHPRGAPILSKLDVTRTFPQSRSALGVRVCHDGALLP
jgi:predicted NodU family carbamoyl transferase